MIILDPWLLYIRESIAAIGVFVIVFGAIRSVYTMFLMIISRDFDFSRVRLDFGNSVIVGLEFMVGADIVGSLVEPDYYNLGLLAILVIVRTILSYFLNLELQELTPAQRKSLR